VAWAEARILRLGAAVYRVRFNPPGLGGLTVRQRPIAGFAVLPTASLEFADPSLCVWRWYTSVAISTPPEPVASAAENAEEDEWGGEVLEAGDEGAWTPAGDGECFTPTAADVGRYLLVRCVPGARAADGTVEYGPPGYAQSRAATAPGPAGWAALMGPRFEHGRRARLDAVGGGGGGGGGRLLRVVSYNVLADTYATSSFAREKLYAYCPSDCLQVKRGGEIECNTAV
jgi:hypothetical protein